jgi:hypothetical protein
MYLVTSIWRGALHIGPMRIFSDEDSAWKYVDDEHMYGPRVYLVSSDAAPKLLKRKPKSI